MKTDVQVRELLALFRAERDSFPALSPQAIGCTYAVGIMEHILDEPHCAECKEEFDSLVSTIRKHHSFNRN